MAARRWSLAVPIAAGLFVVAPFVVPSWILFILHLALAKFLVVLAVALFLRGGLVSFGHALFYAVGAYTAGFAAKWFGVREAVLLVPLGGLFGAAVAAVLWPHCLRVAESFWTSRSPSRCNPRCCSWMSRPVGSVSRTNFR